MGGTYYKRKGHQRRIGGRLVGVREAWVYKNDKPERKRQSFPTICPTCKQPVFRVRMPNFGAVHFEVGEGLSSVKHACFTVGRGLSKKRDQDTLDLFGEDPRASDTPTQPPLGRGRDRSCLGLG